MEKEEILEKLKKSYLECKEWENTHIPHQRAFNYGMLSECIRSILKTENKIK